MLQDQKTYCLQAGACIIQPGNFTGWGSEGVNRPNVDDPLSLSVSLNTSRPCNDRLSRTPPSLSLSLSLSLPQQTVQIKRGHTLLTPAASFHSTDSVSVQHVPRARTRRVVQA